MILLGLWKVPNDVTLSSMQAHSPDFPDFQFSSQFLFRFFSSHDCSYTCFFRSIPIKNLSISVFFILPPWRGKSFPNEGRSLLSIDGNNLIFYRRIEGKYWGIGNPSGRQAKGVWVNCPKVFLFREHKECCVYTHTVKTKNVVTILRAIYWVLVCLWMSQC